MTSAGIVRVEWGRERMEVTWDEKQFNVEMGRGRNVRQREGSQQTGAEGGNEESACPTQRKVVPV